MEERKKKYKKRRRGRQQQQQKMHTHTHTHTAGKWKSDGRFGREKSADLSGNRISVQTLDPQKNGGGSQRDGDADGFGIKYAHTRRRGGSIDPYSRTQHTQTHRTDLGPFSRIGLVCVHVYIYAAFFFLFVFPVIIINNFFRPNGSRSFHRPYCPCRKKRLIALHLIVD